jgi:predicted transcriptional regulator
LGKKKQKSTQIRLKEHTHARLQALAEIEGRDMNLIIDRVFTAFLQQNHPELITAHPEIVKSRKASKPQD